MTIFYSKILAKIVKKWPGRKILGPYRFLPIFFVSGAALEFFMINWRVGEVNFYKTYKKRQVEELVKMKLDAKNLEK